MTWHCDKLLYYTGEGPIIRPGSNANSQVIFVTTHYPNELRATVAGAYQNLPVFAPLHGIKRQWAHA